MAPLSGVVELYGSEISWAGQIACAEVNEAGGVLGRPLELIIADDGSLPDTAVPAAIALVEERQCSAIIGNLLSNSRIAVAEKVAYLKRIPFLNFSFYEGSIINRYFFSFAALPNQQIDMMIPYMANRFGPKMYFAGSNYEWPRGSIDAAKKTLIKEGGEVVGETYLPIGESDIGQLLDKVSKSGADVFVPYFAGAEQINLLNLFAKRGLKQRIAVVMGHYDEAMASMLSPSVREGLYSSNTYFMSVNTSQNTRYMRHLAKIEAVEDIWPKGNGVLTNFGEGTYICVHAFAKAANAAGSLNSEALVDALEKVQVKAPQGIVKMDPDSHHAIVNSFLSRCNADGTFTIKKSFGRIKPIIPQRYLHDIDLLKITPDRRSTTVAQQNGRTTMSPGGADLASLKLDNRGLSAIGEQILQNVDTVILVVNDSGGIIHANRFAGKLFGYGEGEMLGLHVNHLLPPYLRSTHKNHIEMFIRSDAKSIPMGRRGEILGYRKDGSEFPSEATLVKVVLDEQCIVVVTINDITKRKEEEQRLLWDATHDPLTNLPNRILIYDRIGNSLRRLQRTEKKVALIFIDIDSFKLVNDSYGHRMGDRLLVEIGKILVEIMRAGDTVARMGGDEFVMLSEQINNLADVARIAERVLRKLRKPIEIDNDSFFVTASLGIAISNELDQSAEEMMRKADSAMYIAKEEGRDRWKVYNEDIYKKIKQELAISNGLRTAIANGELHLNFQPIVDLDMKCIRGAEALLRWRREGIFIKPDVFIPIAEKTRAINEIGVWVYEQACQALSLFLSSEQAANFEYLAVNLSTQQLNDKYLVEKFSRILEKTGVDPQYILLEITETALMTNADENIAMIEQLAKLGHKISIDDFGTGYSSLKQLISMPVNYLKIDKIFVDKIQHNKTNLTLVTAIINLARSLGINIIAEGVETTAQMTILNELGCHSIQGYLFSKPLVFTEFMSFVKNQKSLWQDL